MNCISEYMSGKLTAGEKVFWTSIKYSQVPVYQGAASTWRQAKD